MYKQGSGKQQNETADVNNTSAVFYTSLTDTSQGDILNISIDDRLEVDGFG
ncbi:MAG: hypothetical protein ABRQ25_16805 [Clostridiaceae bacterium]